MEFENRIAQEQKNDIPSHIPSHIPSLKIGSTKIALVKENSYTIESTNLLVNSINDNITHNNSFDRHVKITPISNTKNGKHARIHVANTKTELYNKIKMEFNAKSVMPLATFLNKNSNKNGVDYNVILHFIGNIGNQLTFLRRKGYSIPFFSLEDFIVIDNSIFSFMNDDKIFKIDDETKNITVDYPLKYNKNNSFIPPHVMMGLSDTSDKIPTDIYFSSIYYSLAQICVYIFLREQIKDEDDYDKISGPFIYTSLYWCLKRCLDKDENKRILLYV
jgi:hypothetical protein